MARGVVALAADRLADPLLELRLGQVVVVDPALITGVVGRVDVDALDTSGVRRQERLERGQIVALDDEVAVQSRLLPLGQERQFRNELQTVVRHRVVVRLDDGFALELDRRHPDALPLGSNEATLSFNRKAVGIARSAGDRSGVI